MRDGPQARRDGLTVERIGDELLVFDEASFRAHSLNAVAAEVWQACDGVRDVRCLAAHTGLASEVVELALRDLRGCDLLTVTDTDRGDAEVRVSRRSLLRRAVVTGTAVSVAVPVIRSIFAPSAAAAGSLTGTCPEGLHTHSFLASVNSTCACNSGSCACQSGGPLLGNGRCYPSSVCTSSDTGAAGTHCLPYSAYSQSG